MAITTRTELISAAGRWLDREDDAIYTARAGDFIALVEARLARIGLFRTMEQVEALTLTIGVDYVALPADFQRDIAVDIVISDVPTPLLKRLPAEFAGVSNSIPTYYAIDNANMLFDCPAAAAYTVNLRYIASFALTEASPTNDLLTRAPDVYLWGMLAEAAPYFADPERTQLYEGKYQRAVSELNKLDSRARNVPLRTDLGRVRSNIFTG